MKAKYTILAFELSFKCPIRCRSCANGDLPQTDEVSLNDAMKVLDMAAEVPDIRGVGFAGGEPFLLFEKMVDILNYARRKYGYVGSVSTSCYWASSIEKARSMLEKLHRAGLISILVSVDDFHQEFVELQNAGNCIKAAQELGIACIAQTITTRNGRKGEDFRRELEKLIDAEKVEWIDNPCDPIGRAVYQVPENDLLLKTGIGKGECSILRVLNVWADGSVKPCCGSGLIAKPLTIGNVKEEKLIDIIKRAECSPLINALVVWGGPYLLGEILRQEGYGKYLLDEYTSECHACYHILSNDFIASLLRERLDEKVLELLAARMIAEEEYGYFEQKPDALYSLPSSIAAC